MNLLQYFKFFGFLVYAFMVGYILYKNSKSLLNITCALIISSFAIWTIADPRLISENIAKDTVILLNNIASLGWISLASFSVCFSLVFSKREKLLNKKGVLVLIFILPLILLYKQWTVGLNNPPIFGDNGWSLSWKESFWTYLFYVYNFSFMLICIYFIHRHGTQTKQIAEKKQSKIIVATTNISLIGVTIVDLIMPALNIHIIPQIGNVFLFVFAWGCIYAIVKYEFLTVSFAIAAENIISTMEELLILTDVEGKITNVNKAVIDSLKYEHEELTGQSVAILFNENSLTTSFLGKIITGQIIKSHETNLLTKDACEIPVIFSGSPLKDKRGSVQGIVFIATDITLRKQSEEALIERERLLLESQEIARLGSYALRANVKRFQELNLLQSRLQSQSSIEQKLKLITDAVVQILDADFARIWMIKSGDRCEAGCVHAQVADGEHICRFRDRCLYLKASSGRYTHTNGEVHARVPFGCYKIGKIAASEESRFLTNDVTTDPCVHHNAWAKELGLVSFAGYRLGDTPGNPLGVLALFSKHPISPEDNSFLELIAHSTSWVLHSELDEAVLHESEERYQNLVESIPDWIWEVDAHGNYTYASPAVRNILGYEPEDMIGRSPSDFMPEDESQQMGVIFKEIIAKRQSIVAMENVNRHRDGRLIVLETNCNPIFDDNGKLKGYRGIDRDVTARKQSEDALARERYLMNALMSNLPDYIYFKDKESRFLKISDALAKSFGLSVPEEAIGKTDFDFFSEEHARQAYNDEQEIIQLGKPLVKEEKETWLDRPSTWNLTTKLPLMNKDGEIVGTFGISMDITERKKIEEALKESERLLRESQEVAGLGSFSWNISKGLWTSSSILDRIFGIDESYIRSLEGWLAIIHPDFREAMQNYVANDVLRKKQKFDKEYKIINKKSGQECWVHGLGQLEFDSNYQPIKLIGTIQDITERKLSEETINNSKSKLSIALKIAHLGAWEYDVANDIFTFNDSFYAIFRTNADEVGGNTMSSADYANRFVYPEDLSIVGDEIKMLIETDNPDYSRQFEHRMIYADGGIGYIAVRIGIVKDENGRTIKTFGINQDVTERKKYENEIISNSKRLKVLVEILQYPSHSIQGYLDFALNRAIEMTDSKIGFIFFYSEEKKEFVLNSGSNEVMSECAIAEKQTVWQLENAGLWGEAVRQRRSIVVNDYKMPNSLKKGCPEGHAPLHKILIIPVFEDDKIVGVVVVANKETDYLDADIMQLTVLMDIVWKASEKNKSDIALRESEEKLSTLFGSMTEMVTTYELVFNKNGSVVNYKITDCNDAFTTITGIKKEDAIGKLATEVYQTDTPPHLEEYAQVALTGESYEFDNYSESLDMYFMTSVVSPRKNIFATITKDVSEIQQKQEEIKAKSKDLENFIYITSHDLRSPLVNLQGFSQRLQNQTIELNKILSDKEFSEDEKRQLEKIMKADIPKSLNFIMQNVFKMDTLINGLLQLSRTGRMSMTVTRIDMDQMFDAIIKNHNFQLTEIKAEVKVNAVTECYGDENLLNQLFSNIISNAIKYRDINKKLSIEISSQFHFNKVIYCVKDSGVGINERHLEKIWDVFYRVDATLSEVGEGLGLSLAKKIAERNKGKIWAESEEGEGSTFYVELQKNEFSEN